MKAEPIGTPTESSPKGWLLNHTAESPWVEPKFLLLRRDMPPARRPFVVTIVRAGLFVKHFNEKGAPPPNTTDEGRIPSTYSPEKTTQENACWTRKTGY